MFKVHGLQNVHEKPIRVALTQSNGGEIILSNDEWLLKVRELIKRAKNKYHYIQLGAIQVLIQGIFRGGMNVSIFMVLSAQDIWLALRIQILKG